MKFAHPENRKENRTFLEKKLSKHTKDTPKLRKRLMPPWTYELFLNLS
jgi:hypothetical protein